MFMSKKNKKNKENKSSFWDFFEGFFIIWDLIKGAVFIIPRLFGWAIKLLFKIFD